MCGQAAGGLSHLTDTIHTNAIQLLRLHLCSHGRTAAAPRGGLQSELGRAGGANCGGPVRWVETTGFYTSRASHLSARSRGGWAGGVGVEICGTNQRIDKIILSYQRIVKWPHSKISDR